MAAKKQPRRDQQADAKCVCAACGEEFDSQNELREHERDCAEIGPRD